MESADMDADVPFSAVDELAGGFSDFDDSDLAAAVLSRFQSSDREDHQHLCAAVGVMSQTLKDQGIALTPVAYFGATASSLDRLSRDPASATDPVATALLSFLAIALSRVSRPVIRSRWSDVSEVLVRILRFDSLPAGGVKAALRCASYLLVVGDKSNWASLSVLYGVFIGFVTDQRPKVRKESHSCLHDVLFSFQKLPVLVSASEGITAMFERFLLLAGGSSTDLASSGGSKGAMEVLYTLNALKGCISLMSIKYTNTILKYCKTLLELRQSIVTRNIMEILHALCSSPNSEVASELLMDLLCSIALSLSDKEKSADAMASTARLLHAGIQKAYSLNKQLCIVKLPVIFNALGDILAGEHEEAIFSATEALKGIISTCIDETLIKQGIEQIKNTDGGMRKPAPAIIERICASIEGFLSYRYNVVWDMSFQVVATTFHRLGAFSYYLMAEGLRGLAEMEKLSDDDFPYRKQLHECLGSAIVAMGPEKFLSILPLDAENLADGNFWLLPILKQYIVGAPLSFFSENILVMVKCIKQKSLKLEKEGRIFSSRNSEGLVYALWSLFPAFCNFPVDTSTGIKLLKEPLCNALQQEPDLRGIICAGLQALIQQNRNLVSKKSTISDDELNNQDKNDNHSYTEREAGLNLQAIKSFGPEFINVLSEIFLTASNDSCGCLQSTIHDFASISDEKAVSKIFMRIMKKLLKFTEQATKVKQTDASNESMRIDSSSSEDSISRARAVLLDLAVSLLPGLGVKETDLLYTAIKPAFQDQETLIQKKAYKILSIILKERPQFLSNNLNELLELMIASLPSCQFASKRYRLESLYFLIVFVSKDLSEQGKRDIISSFLTEIILALKEANKRTRNRAYDLLVQIGHACEDNDGNKEKLHQFFNMIAGGLAGETPHMVSAAVKGLARLAYEFSDLIGSAYKVLPSAFLLLQRKNREIIKANLGLIKVLVAKSNADSLELHLKGMVDGLLKWQVNTKNHFKAKVKCLLEMLVRKCGVEAVKAVMPDEHMKLLTNIRKNKERQDRKAKSEDAESLASGASTSRQSRWNHTRIFSDFGDEDADGDSQEEMELGSGLRKAISRHGSKASLRLNRNRKAAKSLPEDLFDGSEDDPLDLLDRQRTRASLHGSANMKRKQISDDDPEIDADGRLIVREENSKPRKHKNAMDDNSDVRSHRDDGYSAFSYSTKLQKKRRTTDSGWAYTGKEYTSGKAGGDIAKEGKVEPYAYWPLDRKLLNRRAERKSAARKGMSRIMKFTKKLEGRSASGAALSVKRVSLKKKTKGRKK